jgi:hypothetical protein
MLNWTKAQIQNVHSWIYISSVSFVYTCDGSNSNIGKPGVVVGIVGFNYNEKEQQQQGLFNYGGLQGKGDGGYQGGGTTQASFNGTDVFFARIKNFKIRKHGTLDEFQPYDEGKGLDGDTL